MSKPVKDLITQEYENRYSTIDSACVINVIGLDSISTNRLRSELNAKQVKVQVVRNSLARRALEKAPLGPLASALDGPCALVTGGESMIDVAKLLVGMKKTYPKMELKIAMIDGDPDLVNVEKMATFKTRIEVLGEVAMLIASPGRRIAASIQSPAAKIAGCAKTIADKGDGGSESAEAVAA